MGFSEAIKLEVRRKAGFRCCLCQETGVDVHHIVPEAEGGPDKIENAAPLCPNCHDKLGPNVEKRKMIIQARDWWYERVQAKWGGDRTIEDELKKMNENVSELKKGNEDLPALKSQLMNLLNTWEKWVTPKSAASIASGFVAGSTTGYIASFPVCPSCGKTTSVLVHGLCSDCDSKMRP